VDCKIDKSPDERRHVFPSGSRESFEEMNAFLEEHQVHPVIDAVFAWSKRAKAFRALKAGKHFGKLVLRPD
jgi:NADPH:quinone reductase-like Zn-dependent oxidoreductase